MVGTGNRVQNAADFQIVAVGNGVSIASEVRDGVIFASETVRDGAIFASEIMEKTQKSRRRQGIMVVADDRSAQLGVSFIGQTPVSSEME